MPDRDPFVDFVAIDPHENVKRGISLPYAIMFHYTLTSSAYSLEDLNFIPGSHDGAELVKLTRCELAGDDTVNVCAARDEIISAKLHLNDVITIKCTAEGSASLRRLFYLEIYEQKNSDIQLTTGGRSKRSLFEVIPSKECGLIGRKTDASFASKYQIFILAVSSANFDLAKGSNDRIEAGDFQFLIPCLAFACRSGH